MPIEFTPGDISQMNTKIGDKVVYITSPERGNAPDKRTRYYEVEVQGFTKERVKISFDSGHKVAVKHWHLFKVESLDIIRVEAGKDNQEDVKVIRASAQVSRLDNGDYAVEAFMPDYGKYIILRQFTGPGKLKKAKELVKKLGN